MVGVAVAFERGMGAYGRVEVQYVVLQTAPLYKLNYANYAPCGPSLGSHTTHTGVSN